MIAPELFSAPSISASPLRAWYSLYSARGAVWLNLLRRETGDSLAVCVREYITRRRGEAYMSPSPI